MYIAPFYYWIMNLQWWNNDKYRIMNYIFLRLGWHRLSEFKFLLFTPFPRVPTNLKKNNLADEKVATPSLFPEFKSFFVYPSPRLADEKVATPSPFPESIPRVLVVFCLPVTPFEHTKGRGKWRPPSPFPEF